MKITEKKKFAEKQKSSFFFVDKFCLSFISYVFLVLKKKKRRKENKEKKNLGKNLDAA